MIPYIKGLPISSFNNFYNDLPYTGRSDYFGSISYTKGFGPALTIRMVPIRDFSMDYPDKTTDFDKLVSNINYNLPKGSKITAIIKDTSTDVKNGRMVSGVVDRIDYDFENQLVHIYVLNSKTGERVEVYPETVFREIERQPYTIKSTNNNYGVF